jgi:hypothetical protein
VFISLLNARIAHVQHVHGASLNACLLQVHVTYKYGFMHLAQHYIRSRIFHQNYSGVGGEDHSSGRGVPLHLSQLTDKFSFIDKF